MIERALPGAGQFTPEQLIGISQASCGVLSTMGPQIQWIQRYVTGDTTVREHAARGGFPANSVAEVTSIIDPTTAEG